MKHGFVYLFALIDLYSRKIMSYTLSNTMSTDFCISGIAQGLKVGKPTIINSDQGSQFTSKEWTTRLAEEGIQISMNGVGRCTDNGYIERSWRSIKYEGTHLYDNKSMQEVQKVIDDYVHFYNTDRPHQSLKYATPDEVYVGRKSPPSFLCGCVYKAKPLHTAPTVQQSA
jgi:putative transposase